MLDRYFININRNDSKYAYIIDIISSTYVK